MKNKAISATVVASRTFPLLSVSLNPLTLSTWVWLSAILCFGFLTQNASAQNQWWDNNGASAPTSGIWDTTTLNWTTSTSSNLTASTVVFTNGNFPEFAAGSTAISALTITVNSAVACAGMATGLNAATVTNLTFSGTGSISIASGVQGFYCGPAASTLTFNVPLTGPGELQQHSSGSLALYGTNTYTGGTAVTGGQVIYYNNNNSFGTGPIVVGGTGNALVNGGANAVTITNNFTFPTAGYSINLAGGNPVAGVPGTTFTGNFPLPSTGAITLNTSSTATEVIEISGVISGASAVTVADDGTLQLAGTNTYTGGTTISSPAILSIIGSGCLGVTATTTNYAGNITNGGTFNYASAAVQTLSGTISGAGALVDSGSGALTLGGVNTYTGATTVNSGILNISGSIAGNITVTNSGAVNILGSIGGNLTVNAGTAQLQNATALASTSTLTLPTSPSAGTINLNFTGTQTIDGLNFGATSMAPGTYGAVGNTSATFQNAAFTGSGILSVTVSSGSISYWDANGSDATSQTSAAGGGTGNWDNSTADWWLSGASDSVWPAGTVATFGGTAGTVTVAASVVADALTFKTPGYTLNGASPVTFASPSATIAIPAGAATTISSPIAGGAALTNISVSGPGTLILSGANTYTATTTVTNGATLSVNAIPDSGASDIGTGPLTLWGGELAFTGSSGQTARTVTANGTTTDIINVPTGNSLTLNGQVHVVSSSASQALTFTGGGTLTLGGTVDNSSLDLAISAGTVIINKTSSSTAHGLGGGTSTVASGAELQLSGSGSYDLYSGCILSVASGGLFDLNGQSDSMSTLTISGNGFGNGVLINSSATPSSLTNAGSGIVLAGNTTIGGTGNITLASTVAGDYALTYIGTPGTLGLSGANTFNGGVNITPGSIVQVNNATGAGTGPVILGSGSTLGVAVPGNNAIFANPVSGPANSTVNLIETAANNLQINSDMSAFLGTMKCPPTPGTTAKAQILTTTFSINPAATITVANGGTLYIANPSVTIPCTVILNGTGNTEAYGALRLEAGAVISGPVNLLGNTTMGNAQSGIAKAATISGIISGGFGITFTLEPGTIVLSGANTYTGNTTMNGCVLNLDAPEIPGTSGPLGAPATPAGSLICKGGGLQFTPANHYDYSSRFSSASTVYAFDENGQTVTFGSAIAGTASFTNVSSIPGGVLILAAANTYTGNTTVSSGTLQLDALDTPGTSGPLGASTSVGSILLTGGALQYAAANNAHDYSSRFSTNIGQTYNIDVNGQNVVYATALTSSNGVLTLTSSIPGGSLSLNGTNTFNGALTINPGSTFVLSGGGCLGVTNTATNYAAAITDHGAFNYASSANQSLSGVIFGAGSLTQSGSGTLTLSNANTYYGGTTVSAGTLHIGAVGSIQGNVAVSGGVLQIDNANALTAGATLTLATSPSAGSVNLNFSGVQTVNALSFGSTPMAPGTYGAVGNTSVTYQNAAFTGSGILSVGGQTAFWDPSALNATPGSGGTGSWDSSTSDWFNGTSDTTWTAGNTATFAGSPGTVTLNASVSADGLTFGTNNYTLTGSSTLTLSGASGNSTPMITIPSGNTTIACPVTVSVPTNALIVNGPGTLALTEANSFTNSTVVTGGATLSVNSIADNGTSAVGALGTFGNGTSTGLTLLDGNLSFTGSSGQTARTITVQGATTDTISVPSGGTLEFDGQVHEVSDTAPQTMTFSGGGTLIMGGTVDNSGLTMAINAGTVVITKISTSTVHGLGGGTSTVASNATLQLSGAGNYDLYSGCILTVASGGVFDLNGQSDSMSTLTLSGSGIGGNGALVNSGGPASLTNAGSAVVLATNTTIGGNGNITLTSIVSGYGMSLTYVGTGNLILGGANTYSGGLNLAPNARVQLTAAAGGGTGTINIGSGAILIAPSALTIANAITGGSSSVIQINEPAGNTFLTGSLTGFTGTVNCQTATTTGQLVINNINNEAYPISPAATFNLAPGATVDFATPYTNNPASVIINGAGNNQIYGALRLDACNQQGNVLLNAANCLIGDGNTTGPSTISGVISDNGAGYGFIKVGSAIGIVLTAPNTYSGPTVVSNGTLAISGAGSITNSSSISLAPGTAFDVSGVSGSYPITANQTLANLSGSATLNGNLNLNAGATVILNYNTAASPLVVSGGTVTLNNNPMTLTIANTVSPTANGYLLMAATNGGSVAGNVASSVITINGQSIPPGGPYLSIVNGSLYLVAGPPDIMVGPVPVNPIIYTSNSVTFNVTVFGAPTLTNQWYTNGSPISGATNTSVTLVNLPAGTYTVTFGSTNSFSPPASGSSTLTVVARPTTSFAQSVLALNPLGYWRLNESETGNGDDGVICHDYIAGNNGIYTNVILGNQGFDAMDSIVTGDTNYDSETSAEFGTYNNVNSCAYNIPNIDFSTPTNKSAAFTVEAWVQCLSPIGTAINTPGVVGKGIYGAEEFTIDCGTHIGAVDAYRFEVRNAGATVYNANSTLIAGADTNWHYLVGVCDEAHGSVTLYIDGTNAATTTIPVGSGIVATDASLPMSIGARTSAGISFDEQFTGFVNDVAIFTNALTASQIQSEYLQAGIPPTVALASNSIIVNEFGTTVMPSTPYGTPNLALQWYLTDINNNVTAISGQTNAVLTLSNVLASYNNVFVVVTNAYGSVTSAPAYFTVNIGGAYIAVDTGPSIMDVPAGTILTYSVVAYGALPISYEWLLNGSTVIPGATNSSYTFAAQFGTNTYTCAVSNSQSGSWNPGHAATIMAENTPPVLGLNNTSLWSLQHSGSFSPTISSGVLELTSSAGSEAASAFYEIPQYISNGFVASFTYTPSAGSATRADGTTFVLQNSANGYQALGAGGGDLGYFGITNSVAFEMDLYSSSAGGTGINWETNGFTAGASGLPNGTNGPVNINSLDPIGVQMNYSSSSGILQVVLTDLSHSTETYTTNYTVGNLATTLGSVAAYVGFTAGTGGSYAEQQISDFSFFYTAPQQGPVILNDIAPTNMDAPVGAQITYSVGTTGTPPLYYQWLENGSPISGATGSSYTFAAPAGSNNFQVGVSNAISGNVSTYSSIASVTASVTPPVVDLSANSLWQWQGTVANLTSGVLTLTTAAADETGSAYYTIPQYINNGFVASFTYTPSAGSATRADGMAFVLQNSLSGPFAIGVDGGGLGVDGTGPSVNFDLDLYTGAAGGTGINWETNGASAQEGGLANGGTGSVNINSLDPIAVVLTYHPELGNLQVTLSDTVSKATYSTNYTVGNNLAASAGGDSAYVGFTGGTGASYAGQQISNFSFTYVGAAAAIVQDLAPLNYAAYVGESVTYSVIASGTQPISYAWFVNSNLVSGATNSSFTLTVPASGSNTVQCGVSNSYSAGYALSSVATVIGIALPSDPYGSNVLAQGPIAYWRLNEPQGSATAYDYVGGFNGTYGADTTNGQPGVPNLPFHGLPTNDLGVWMDTNVANAAGFVTTPALNVTVSNCTLLGWVYPSGSQNNSDGLIFARGSSASSVIGINYGAGNEMAYTWNNNSATYDWTSGLVIPSNQWSLLALVITPSNAVASVFNANGLMMNTNAVANTPATINAGFAIGADPQSSTLGQRTFNGEMDDFAVFATALSSNQLAQIYLSANYQAPSGPPPAPAVSIQLSGTNVVLSWSAGANLFSAPAINGPWTLVTNASSPYTSQPSPTAEFYKAGTPYTP
jgi:autotransporter-associated beta strand protein